MSRSRSGPMMLTLLLVLSIPAASARADGDFWIETGNLSIGRYGHTVTALPSGKALIAFGMHHEWDYKWDSSRSTTAELFDPATLTYSPAASLPEGAAGRSWHGAILLESGSQAGKVLVFGGLRGNHLDWSDLSTYLADCYLYDPPSDSWTETGSLPPGFRVMQGPLLGVTLWNGNVLVCGGHSPHPSGTNLCAIYDSGSGTWSMAAPMHVARAHQAVILLGNGSMAGKVLVAGGISIAADSVVNPDEWTETAEVYDPARNTWTMVDPLPEVANEMAGSFHIVAPAGKPPGYQARRAYVFGAMLPDGRALIAGGFGPTTDDVSGPSFPSFGVVPRSTSFTFDGTKPRGKQWKRTGSLNTPRASGSLSVLVDGRIIYASGIDGPTQEGFFFSHSSAAVEIFDSANGVWDVAADIPMTGNVPLFAGFDMPPGAVLRNGSLLFSGGLAKQGFQSLGNDASALYTPPGP
jgi:galactose oxidase-like protein